MRYYGVYKGIVELNVDIEMGGRLKVRVPELHGTIANSPVNTLPWAEVATMGGGHAEAGSYEPFAVGALVYVMFEKGRLEKPIVIGGVRSIAKQPTTVKVGNTSYLSPTGAETPECVKGSNTARIIYKSPTGHTIIADDMGGSEYIMITDRAGAALRLWSPMPPAAPQRKVEDGFQSAPEPGPSPVQGSGSIVEMVTKDGQTLFRLESGGDVPTLRVLTQKIIAKAPTGAEVELGPIDVKVGDVSITGGKAESKFGDVSMEAAKFEFKTPTFDIGGGGSLKVPISDKLITILQDLTTYIQDHTHIGNEGAPTSRPVLPVPPVPDTSTWSSGIIVVKS